MELLARTRIVAWEGASLWVVDATPNPLPTPRQTDVHAHHAIQVTVGAGGVFKLIAGELVSANQAVAVAADIDHVFEAEGLVAILFVEPESRLGRAVSQRLFSEANLALLDPGDVAGAAQGIAAAFHSPDAQDEVFVGLGRDLIARLAGQTISESPDWRVRKMIRWAAQHLEGSASVADVAPVVGLSAGRLSHLFAEQTGLQFRTYLLWLRLTRAVSSMAAGIALTQAAHEAGFADSAHFSRTFRRMFGVAPTNLRMS
ncbi:MAG: AraC family transcriptional regulator [Caulobacteraceae bacterium]|nr:AraC family transcriptional regulator [Caulobacteraceae bacterium]